MPTPPRDRIAKLFAAVLVGAASAAGVTGASGCGEATQQAAQPQTNAQAALTPPSAPRQVLPSNAPAGGSAIAAGSPEQAAPVDAPPPAAPAGPVTTPLPPATPPEAIAPVSPSQPTSRRPAVAAAAVQSPPTAVPAVPAVMPVPTPTPVAAASVTAAQSPVAPASTMPPVPSDAQWTIFCYSVQGPDHVQGATAARDALVQKTGKPEWYVIHGRDVSNLYFGFYRSVDPNDRKNAGEVARAHADLKTVQAVPDKAGKKPFERSAFVALDAPDPTAAADLNLANVDRALDPQDPRRAFWSVHIMSFRGDKLRKEAAVQACRDLRAQGVEAYYYHGVDISSVTVGKWPAGAVKAQNRTDDRKDVAAAASNSDIVVSSIPLPDDYKPKRLNGKDTVAVAPKLEVLDPTLAAMMKRYPNNAVNYEIGQIRGKNGQTVLDPSFLVEIPRDKGNGLFDSAGPAAVAADPAGGALGGRPAGSSMIAPSAPRPPGRRAVQ
ncbi:MAG: hypothetical protein JWO31_1322 [Phycisphaerales bacterium]|nr:hypothetical protein [Phycisphaerales bacterium]